MIFRFIRLKVVNRPGVLNRVTQVVLKPRYNIDTLTLAGTDDPTISYITIGINFQDEEAGTLLTRQLQKQVDVISADQLSPEDLAEGR